LFSGTIPEVFFGVYFGFFCLCFLPQCSEKILGSFESFCFKSKPRSIRVLFLQSASVANSVLEQPNFFFFAVPITPASQAKFVNELPEMRVCSIFILSFIHATQALVVESPPSLASTYLHSPVSGKFFGPQDGFSITASARYESSFQSSWTHCWPLFKCNLILFYFCFYFATTCCIHCFCPRRLFTGNQCKHISEDFSNTIVVLRLKDRGRCSHETRFLHIAATGAVAMIDVTNYPEPGASASKFFTAAHSQRLTHNFHWITYPLLCVYH
jgi:hypothetical protein